MITVAEQVSVSNGPWVSVVGDTPRAAAFGLMLELMIICLGVGDFGLYGISRYGESEDQPRDRDWHDEKSADWNKAPGTIRGITDSAIRIRD